MPIHTIGIANEQARKKRNALLISLENLQADNSDEAKQQARLALNELLLSLHEEYGKQVTSRHPLFVPLYEVSLPAVAHALNQLNSDQKHALFSKGDTTIDSWRLRQIDVLIQLTADIRQKTWASFIQSRQENGFTHFFADLKDSRHNALGSEWTLKNGLLSVTVAGMTNPQTATEIHQLLDEKLGQKPWYEKPTELATSKKYLVNFKTLGKNKDNKAVDPVILIKGIDGRLKVLCGQRFDGSYAFPGGMNESNVTQTCIDELIEECFSGALFAKSSPSALALDKQSLEQEKIIKHLFLALLSAEKASCPDDKDPLYTEKFQSFSMTFNRIARQISDAVHGSSYPEESEASADIDSAAQRIARMATAPTFTSAQIIQRLIQSIEEDDEMDKGKKPSFIAAIRRELYKSLLNPQYEKLVQFVKDNMHKEPLVPNDTDPRNTNFSHMATNPLEMVIDEEAATAFFTDECCLSFSAGDDLGSVAFRDIDEFSRHVVKTPGKEHYTYSDHSVLLLNAITRAVTRGELTLTDTISQQLSVISETNLGKEFELEHLVTQQLPAGHPVM